jgi:hypothetical protein
MYGIQETFNAAMKESAKRDKAYSCVGTPEYIAPETVSL